MGKRERARGRRREEREDGSDRPGGRENEGKEKERRRVIYDWENIWVGVAWVDSSRRSPSRVREAKEKETRGWVREVCL